MATMNADFGEPKLTPREALSPAREWRWRSPSRPTTAPSAAKLGSTYGPLAGDLRRVGKLSRPIGREKTSRCAQSRLGYTPY